VDKG